MLCQPSRFLSIVCPVIEGTDAQYARRTLNFVWTGLIRTRKARSSSVDINMCSCAFGIDRINVGPANEQRRFDLLSIWVHNRTCIHIIGCSVIHVQNACTSNYLHTRIYSSY